MSWQGDDGKGKWKCYPTLTLAAPSISPYTPSLPNLTTVFNFLFSFIVFTRSLYSTLLCHSLLPLLFLSPALAPQYCPIMESFWQNETRHFLDACVLSYLTVGKRRGAWGFHTEYSQDCLPMNMETRREEGGSVLNTLHHIQERRRVKSEEGESWDGRDWKTGL